MWIVVHIALGKAAADRAVEVLKEHEILATARRAIAKSEDGIYEIVVAQCEAAEAQQILGQSRATVVVRGSEESA